MAHKRFKQEGRVLEVSQATLTSETIAPFSKRDEIPVVYIGDMTDLMITRPIRWQFARGPGFPNYGISACEWVVSDWASTNPPRVAMFIQDYPACHEAVKGVKQYATEIGIEYVGCEVIPLFAVLDTTTEWLRTIAAKPDYVWAGLVGGVGYVIGVKDAARLEVTKKGIKIVYSYPFDEMILSVTGEKAGEGCYVFKGFPSSVETELPGMKDVFEAAKRYRGWEAGHVPSGYIIGWVPTMIGVEAIRMAIEKAGFENLTGRAVRDALATMKDFDTGLIPPVTMSEKKPYYNNCYRMYQWQGGRLVPVSDWREASPLGGYEY